MCVGGARVGRVLGAVWRLSRRGDRRRPAVAPAPKDGLDRLAASGRIGPSPRACPDGVRRGAPRRAAILRRRALSDIDRTAEGERLTVEKKLRPASFPVPRQRHGRQSLRAGRPAGPKMGRVWPSA